MKKKVCQDCRYYETDYDWDGDDEIKSDYCTLDYASLTPDMPACEFFERLRVRRYVEKDTECDRCERFGECKTPKCDVTCIEDTRSHYVPDYGYKCEKENMK